MDLLRDSPLADADTDDLRATLEVVADALANPPASRMAWRFYAALFLYQDVAPLTARQLRDLVRTSNASTSVALRELEHAGLITRTRPAGTRADVYDLVDEAQYGENYANSLRRPQPALRAALEVLPEDSIAALRVRSMIDLGNFLADRLPSLLAQWTEERAHLFGR